MVVLSVSVGAGHMRAAEALVKAGSGLDIVHQDVLELMPVPFQKLYRDSYLDLVAKAPDLFGWLYDVTDKPFVTDHLRQAFEAAGAGRFFEWIDQQRPDVALCTHFLPASLLHRRKFKGRILTVITDFDVHGMWLATPSDHYFVAVEEARAYLESLGIPQEKITVTGIPTDPVFAERKDRQALAEKHGLSNQTTLLLSTGGFGTAGPQLAQELLKLKHPVQILAACGRNQQLKSQLEALPATNLRVLGFTREIDEFMELADVMVGKPGGLTTWESFLKGLAWVVVNPIPGQEERNTYHLLEEGVAIWCYEPRTLVFKLEQLLAEPERLRQMQANAKRMARPDAATEILRASTSSGQWLPSRAGGRSPAGPG